VRASSFTHLASSLFISSATNTPSNVQCHHQIRPIPKAYPVKDTHSPNWQDLVASGQKARCTIWLPLHDSAVLACQPSREVEYMPTLPAPRTSKKNVLARGHLIIIPSHCHVRFLSCGGHERREEWVINEKSTQWDVLLKYWTATTCTRHRYLVNVTICTRSCIPYCGRYQRDKACLHQ
jgi:hypothetical protein